MSETFFQDYSRRDVLRMTVASALGISASGWMGDLAVHAANSSTNRPCRSCILLWMTGGPSQLDTFDLKPNYTYSGPFKPIATSAPGLYISEHLRKLARFGDRLAVLRGMTSKEGDHNRATFLLRTGYREQGAVRYPCLGSLVAKDLGKTGASLPNFVSIAPFRFSSPTAFDSGFLGPDHAPLAVASDNFSASEDLPVQDLESTRVVTSHARERRAALLRQLQLDFLGRHPHSSGRTQVANTEGALRMMTEATRSVFDLRHESPALRDAYGRNRFGQGCLLARRLVERGVPFVEVSLSFLPGNDFGWDTHRNNFEQVERLSRVLDPAWATLMEDLRLRGLLDSTLIVWMGEFGRTPRINVTNGRDHYPAAWTTVLAGGGVRGGQAIGDTGKTGLRVENRPIQVADFMATICTILGMNPHKEQLSDDGRPITLVEKGGQAVREAMA